MRKATLQRYLQIGNMIESGAIDRQLAQAIVEGKIVIRSDSNGESEGAHPYRDAPSSNGCVKREAIEYFTSLSDADVPERYRVTLAKYRKLATDHYVPMATAVCYRVRAGFTLKTHALKAGPCYENFKYLQGWDFPDEATEDCLVFWVPRIIKYSTSKTYGEQIDLLSNFRAQLELPAHHMSGFGKVGLVAGLILAHFKTTGERIPFKGYCVRTDTRYEDGRLALGRFGSAGLHCFHWDYDDSPGGRGGVFALGVEMIGP